MKWGLPIPWQETHVRQLLNDLRSQEVTPHKLQLCWDTLRWFSKKFGMMAVHEEHRLLQKKQTVEEGLTPAITQPSRKAKVPNKEVIWVKHTTNTLEFSAWQTKTVSATRIRKHPVPLICPKFSFTGHMWWQPLLTWWTRLSSHPAFEAIDYLIPTISKDGMGFISRPGQADRTLRWLKDALLRRGVDLQHFHDLTWHSFRVFIPDCAFQLGISRDQRRYVGNWMTESTADVYTREKRNVVVKVWKAVANGMDEICTGGRMVREDLNHPDWDGLPLLPEASPRKPMDRSLEFEEPLEDLEGVVVTPPKKDALPLVLEENPDGEIQETLEHQEDQPVGAQQPLVVKTPADKLGPPNGPLRVVSSSRKSGPGGTFKIHLLTTENKGVGCGWQPSINKAQDLNPLDHRSEPLCYQECARCFRLFGFPTDWPVDPQPAEEDSELSSSSADSLTDDSVDTASETEKVTASTLKAGCPQ